MSKEPFYKGQVTITINEYNELLDRKRKLESLENHGVDNWEWYDAAMEDYLNE